jgi:hypothetical protein
MASANEFLHTSQIEDYRSSFDGSGFSPDEFELEQQRLEATGTFYDPQAGTVTVRRKETGVERSYKLSSGNNWPTDFAIDLQSGAFGRKV